MHYIEIKGELINLDEVRAIRPWDELVSAGRPDRSCERELAVPLIKFYGSADNSYISIRFDSANERDACLSWLRNIVLWDKPWKLWRNPYERDDAARGDADGADDDDDDDGFDFSTAVPL